METLHALLFILILFSVGCMSVQKAQNYLDKKGELPKICAEKFPVKDNIIVKESVKIDTIQSAPQILVDTVYVDGKPLVIHRPCPPDKIITRTITRDSVIIRRDSSYTKTLLDLIAKQEELIKGKDAQIKVQEKINKELKQDKKAWQWKAILTWILAGAAAALFIFKPFKLW